jgi:hypothetical protein
LKRTLTDTLFYVKNPILVLVVRSFCIPVFKKNYQKKDVSEMIRIAANENAIKLSLTTILVTVGDES